MKPFDFEKVLERIIEQDSRYHRDAYHFVREALDFTQQTVLKENQGKPRHVTGQQLLDGIRQRALAQFGPMAQLVLEEWGIRRCEDFGEIVFNLVDHHVLAKTDEDSRNDFSGGYDFHEAFRKPFLPASGKPGSLPKPESANS